MPEKPAEPLNPVMVSDGVTGTAAITLGAEELVYPRPGLVIVILVILPAVIDAVAIAVSPVPTVPSPFIKVVIPVVGIPTEIDVVAPTYPRPPSTRERPVNVPVPLIVAVNSAATGVILLSTIIELKSNDPSDS